MKWLVKITNIASDKQLLIDILKKLGVELYQEDSITYLISDKFETLSTETEVWHLAKQICETFSEVNAGNPEVGISFELDGLYEHQENGSRMKFVFVSGLVNAPRPRLFGIVNVLPNEEITEQDRASLEAERKEREYQAKLDLVSSRVLSIFQDERALKVHRFLQQELTPKNMYDIYELIRDDLGGNINKLVPETELNQFETDLNRFTGSVNSAEVFGDDARHVVPKKGNKPLKKPMSLLEAQEFISKMADLWFRKKASCK